MRDYYEILGVAPNASSEEVRQRYRFLAQAYHPDKFPDPQHKSQAEETFKSVQEAYQTLSNPRRRATYDLSRPTRESHDRPEAARRPRPARSPEPEPPKPPRPARRRRIYGLSRAQWVILGLFLLNLIVRDPILFADELLLVVLFFTIDRVIAFFSRNS